jgi:hypothetical protein
LGWGCSPFGEPIKCQEAVRVCHTKKIKHKQVIFSEFELSVPQQENIATFWGIFMSRIF